MTTSNPDTLAESITKNSSFQTYVTIKLLVDKCLVADCFKAYAYFRWLDDQIDIHCHTKAARITCLQRQQLLINSCYQHQLVTYTYPEEQLIADLIATDIQKGSKLSSFIHNFFAIIAFDAERKGQLISQQQLKWYRQTLAKAVTDGIEHFINHFYTYPDGPYHYQAAEGAHIVHMLRDYYEDIPEGFINIPKEYLSTHHVKPEDTTSPAFISWVNQQLTLADMRFKTGKQYIRHLKVLRGKIAASWYCTRFELAMNEMMHDHYKLRPHYSRRSNVTNYLLMLIVASKIIVQHFLDRFQRN